MRRATEAVATRGNLLFDEVAHDDGLDYLLERILHLGFHRVALRQLQLPRRGKRNPQIHPDRYTPTRALLARVRGIEHLGLTESQ